MTICCDHTAGEHHVVEVCHQMIHYPSEDYPCVCGSLVRNGDTCASCGHAAAQHKRERVCRPAGGEFCACRTDVG